MRKKHLVEEEKIALHHAELMALFAELSPDVIFRIDLSGKITLANNAAHRISPEKGMLGENVVSILPELKCIDIPDIITQNKMLEFNSTINEKVYQFILTGVAKAKVGQIYGRDISELKAQHEKLARALKKAEIAKEMKADFLSRISHEIRMPLAAIQGFSQLILSELDTGIDEEYLYMFRSIENNSKRLYRTIDLILNMSQIQTGDYEPKFEQVDLFPILDKQFKEFKSLAFENNIKFTMNSEVGQSAIVKADYYSIEQVFVNLIYNAFKFTPSGEISLRIYKNESRLSVDIQDTGIGISEEYQKKIFTPFSQEKMGYSRPYEGTGLGLALVKSFADMNEAEIKIKSKINGGSTFTVEFGEKLYNESKNKQQKTSYN